MTFQNGARHRRGTVVAVMAVMALSLTGLTSTVAASAVTWSGITVGRVAALTPTAGTVSLEWVSQTGDRFAVTDVSGPTPVVRVAALDASGWTSHAETPGTHTYRVTRTPGDGTSSSWSEVTVLVPARELLVTEWGLGNAAAPTSNASGITFDTALTSGHASMSPDRQHLAVAFGATGFMELWQTDIAGNRQKQLTHGAFDTDPDFSPDGRTLAFTRRAASNGVPAVYLLDLSLLAGDPSTQPALVPGGADAAMPSWTPAGDAFVIEEHTTGVGANGVQVDAGSTGLAVLTRTGQRTALPSTYGGENPSVSRTGRVAFGRFDPATGQGDILVTDLSGAPALRWSATPPAGTTSVFLDPAWDPQGNTIAATSQSWGGSPGSSQPVTIAVAGAPAEFWRSPEWTRDSTNPSWVDLLDVAPSAVLTAPSTSRSPAVIAGFTVLDGDDAVGGLSATCQVDTRVSQPCTPGRWTLSGLADGPHLLIVRVTDPAGRVGEARRTVVVDAGTRLTDFNRDGTTDLLARNTIGTLWLYPGNGAGGFQARHQLGTGWNIMTAIVTPGDVTGDGNADVLGRDTAGRLWLYPGNGLSGLSPRRQIGAGWASYTITNAGNMNGAGAPDLLARDVAGVLWLYPLRGNAVFGTRIRIGAGWNGYTIRGPGDFSGDGRADILARDGAGALWLYRGNGAGGLTARTLAGSGWQVMTALVTPGNWDLAGGHDVLARDSLGRLWFYPGNNGGGFGTRRLIGSGWNGYAII